MSGGGAGARFDLERIEAAVRRNGASRRFEFREEVGSTQDLAFLLAEHGAPDGSLALAERQAAGRGRLGRKWESPAGAGIWASLVLRPPPEPALAPPLLVAAVALAVSDGIAAATDADPPRIRWPNDLLLGDRKVAGLLPETRDYEPAAPLFVLGMGVNANQRAGDFPADLRATATSLRVATGRAVDRTMVLLAILEAMDGVPDRLAPEGREELESAFAGRAAHVGERVTLLEGNTPRSGVLVSVSPTAGLVLREADGTNRSLRPEHARELRPAPRKPATP